MPSLSILNLNIMHGRNSKSPIFPPCFDRKIIQNNLLKIADLIKEHDPDIVTLQEVDQSSILSGSFDQSEFLNSELKYPYKYFAPSCSIALGGKSIFVSGNAIFSKYPLLNCRSFKFDISFPTDRMGFVIADVVLPNGKVFAVTSIHLVCLDWTRPDPRGRGLELVRRVITGRDISVVIAGDMNCDLSGKERSLRSFANNCGLKSSNIESRGSSTFPSWEPSQRIDWILLSKEMNFISYKTLPDKVSDHLGVLAGISI